MPQYLIASLSYFSASKNNRNDGETARENGKGLFELEVNLSEEGWEKGRYPMYKLPLVYKCTK
jgi:hypothetical protein